jgi:hypothetical protein
VSIFSTVINIPYPFEPNPVDVAEIAIIELLSCFAILTEEQELNIKIIRIK